MQLATGSENGGHNFLPNIDEMEWFPLYPNNMICNGIIGQYCLLFHRHNTGVISARKYTILYQHEEMEPASGHINPNSITHYILFEKAYYDVNGALYYPSPSERSWFESEYDREHTFNAYDVNSYGSFVYAYSDIATAKQRAVTQYSHIYGYVLPHLDESQQ